MPITIKANSAYVAANKSSRLAASGGVGPYVWALLPNGAGGSIDPSGKYTAPKTYNADPKKTFDVVQVTDANAETATFTMNVSSPPALLCQIIQQELGLDNGRV